MHTWEKGLSSAKFGAFDFLLNIDVKMTHNSIKFLGRKIPDQNEYGTVMRTIDSTLFIRVGIYEISSYSIVSDDSWHNVKLFYNAREGR